MATDKPAAAIDPLHPSVAVLVKLGSALVHVDELLSPEGHDLDASALRALLADPEVVGWVEAMNGMALLPVKRSG